VGDFAFERDARLRAQSVDVESAAGDEVFEMPDDLKWTGEPALAAEDRSLLARRGFVAN